MLDMLFTLSKFCGCGVQTTLGSIVGSRGSCLTSPLTGSKGALEKRYGSIKILAEEIPTNAVRIYCHSFRSVSFDSGFNNTERCLQTSDGSKESSDKGLVWKGAFDGAMSVMT